MSLPFISFVDVNKVYPNGVEAVIDFNLDIYQHEFIVLVGPSGCGKSTTLRMLAGLEDISHGTLFINGEIANNLTPKERDLAMVFQSYALYPHMSIYNNLAFGLRMRPLLEPVLNEDGKPTLAINNQKINEIERILKVIHRRINRVTKKLNKLKSKPKVKEEQVQALAKVLKDLEDIHKSYSEQRDYYVTTPLPLYKKRKATKAEIDEKVKNAAEVLDITKYLHSKPRELSGGQRQRVALGRSIVRNASMFLMDEPLSNLDAKLRILMRSEIVSLHRRLKSTTIYVTHDQTEAMTMADRIVIMKDGYIMQVGTPQEIYEKPSNLFTATFIGSPEMNIFKVSLNKEGLIFTNGQKFNDQEIYTKYRDYINGKNNQFADHPDENAAKSHYLELSKHHDYEIYFGVRPENITLSAKKSANTIRGVIKAIELLGKEYYIHLEVSGKTVVAISATKDDLTIDQEVYLKFDYARLYYFDVFSEERI